MTLLQKISLAAAVAAALIVVVRKAMAYARASHVEDVPTLQPIDALPTQAEPLDSNDLRVAQNAPL